MQLRDIEYVLAIAEHKSFSKAAKALFVSQPAISQQLQRLEQELSVQLFERSGANVSLTPAGEVFVEHARELMQKSSDILKRMQDHTALREGSLTVCSSPLYGKLYLPPILRIFHERYPRIKLRIFDDFGEHVERDLLEGNLDLAFGAFINVKELYDMSVLEQKPLLYDPLLIAVPRSFTALLLPLKTMEGAEPCLCLEALRDVPLIAAVESHSLGTLQEKLFLAAGIRDNIILRSNNFDSLHRLVLEGLGASLLPRSVRLQNPIGDERVAYYSLPEDLLESRYAISFLYNKRRHLSAAAKAFIALFEEFYREQILEDKNL